MKTASEVSHVLDVRRDLRGVILSLNLLLDREGAMLVERIVVHAPMATRERHCYRTGSDVNVPRIS